VLSDNLTKYYLHLEAPLPESQKVGPDIAGSRDRDVAR
jgi:hypothetical protein